MARNGNLTTPRDDRVRELELEGHTNGEATDLVDLERGSTAPQAAQVIATDYVHTTHPETGLEVVFVPGEALPAWAAPAPEPSFEPNTEQKSKPSLRAMRAGTQESPTDPAETADTTA